MNREEIICNYDKSNFMFFLQNDYDGKIIELLNEEGLALLKKCDDNKDKIAYILVFSRYRNELFKNKKFLETFFSIGYYGDLSNLDYETSLFVFKESIELKKYPEYIFNDLNIDYKLMILDNWNYPYDLLELILQRAEPKVIKKILDKFNINLCNLNIESFIEKCNNSTLHSKDEHPGNNIEIHIPAQLINNAVCNKVFNEYHIYNVREIINKAAYCTDISYLNSYIKQCEEKVINSSLTNDLLEPFNSLYGVLEKMSKLNDYNEELDEKLNQLLAQNLESKNLYKLKYLFFNEGLDSAYNYLKLLSNRTMSNYIIDYCFEENFHNIIVDINQLLRFYFDGNMSISEDILSIYERISNIDSLSSEEKKELFDEMKNINIMSIFYDDMSRAREIVGKTIRDYSITSDNLDQYSDDELTSKYGVKVYSVGEDDYFYGIVKANGEKTKSQDKLPTGHSFSLVGNNNPNAFFYGPHTYLYDASALNPKQIVHVFPRDSFTFYRPFNGYNEPTTRVNVLMTADELVDSSVGYNEVLILEQGTEATGIDASIPKLTPIAIYCLDEISDEVVEEAKKLGIGIFLAHSIQKNKCDMNGYLGDINYYEYEYYNNSNKDRLENGRIK